MRVGWQNRIALPADGVQCFDDAVTGMPSTTNLLQELGSPFCARL
jgi:hypothetical protein